MRPRPAERGERIVFLTRGVAEEADRRFAARVGKPHSDRNLRPEQRLVAVELDLFRLDAIGPLNAEQDLAHQRIWAATESQELGVSAVLHEQVRPDAVILAPDSQRRRWILLAGREVHRAFYVARLHAPLALQLEGAGQCSFAVDELDHLSTSTIHSAMWS